MTAVEHLPDAGRLRGAALAPGAALAVPTVLLAFSLAAVGAGAARGLTTSYLPVLLERINDAPSLIGAVMTVNAVAGFAVPLVVGLWSDRRAGTGLGRRLPFMIGGTVVAGGGLVAIGLGSGSSYLALAFAAALTYTGLNALTTAHRALVAEDVADARRPAASSAQELLAAIGAGVAVAIGAALIEPAPGAAFALAAVVLALAALPTLVLTRRLGLGSAQQPRPARAARASLMGALRQPGAREVLLAQTLWVLAYAALPAFFVLYARDELSLGVGIAGVLPLAFGLFIAVGMAGAGRVAAANLHRTLVAGGAMLGGGLLLASLATSLAVVAAPLAIAALGAGLLTSLGFPYFARFVPAGEAGGYSGVFFAGRGVASAIALPLAGVVAELTGSYRSVLLLGGASLVALVPLVVAERRLRATETAPLLRRRPASVAAVIPVFASPRAAEVALRTLRHVDDVVLVDDGAPAAIARTLTPLTADPRVRLLVRGENGGKGSAVAAGIEQLLANAQRPDAIVVLDSDGQHDPDRIPAFIDAAATADVVVGVRRDRGPMPRIRRAGNFLASLTLLASARAWVPDTQNGMRLFHTDALAATPPVAGGYDAESRHLRALIASGRRVTSVEIPTIYDGEPSNFRPLLDTLRVARALLAPPPEPAAATAAPARSVTVLRDLAPRLATAVLATLAVAAALPALQPLDSQLFLAVNGLGDGPEWLYQALDPHTRNYILLLSVAVAASVAVLRRPRYVIGTAIAVALAGYLAGAVLEVVKVFIERDRPEELLGAAVDRSHDRSWGHIASFPSGHLIVTAAMATAAAAAAPVLRRPLIAYVVLVAFTRVLFGAHFPLDVLVGAALGYEVGVFTVALLANARLLPDRRPTIVRPPLEEPAPARL